MDPKNYATLAINKSIVEQGITIGRVSHLLTKSPNARLLFNGVDHTIYDWDGSHRSATVIFNDNWIVYRSIGTKVKFQNKRWWGGWWQDDTDYLRLDFSVTYDVSRLSAVQQYITVHPPSQSCQGCGICEKTIDFDVAELGIGGDGPFANLITDPYSFKTFVTNSVVTWRGNTHNDSLEDDQ